MKIRLPLLCVFCLIYNFSLACSFATESFCSALQLLPDDLVVAGVISDIDMDGINLEVIQVLRGVEDRTNIRIWDGTDFDCNGFFSMAAADIGEANDTVVIILPMIDSLENTWEILGDYRRPDPYIYHPALKVENGVLNGFIWGLVGMPDPIVSFPYENFIDNYETNDDCDFTLNTDYVQELTEFTITNPIRNRISLHSGHRLQSAEIQLIDLQGRVHLHAEVNQSYYWQTDADHLPSGVYLLRIQEANVPPRVFKLVKP